MCVCVSVCVLSMLSYVCLSSLFALWILRYFVVVVFFVFSSRRLPPCEMLAGSPDEEKLSHAETWFYSFCTVRKPVSLCMCMCVCVCARFFNDASPILNLTSMNSEMYLLQIEL